MGIASSSCCQNTYANKTKDIEIDTQKTKVKKDIITLNNNESTGISQLPSTNNINKTTVNLINVSSINQYKVNTDVNENVSFCNSKHKEVFANIKEATSPNNSIEKANYVEVDQERINILEQIVDSAPKLILEVIGNSTNQKFNLNVNAQGIEDSLRGKKDGYTFFGVQNDDDNVENDYIFKIKKQNENEIKSRGRHFQLFYNIENSKYFIKDLGVGYGSFMKIKTETILRNNTLINIGDSYLVITMGRDDEASSLNYQSSYDQAQMINLKVFSNQMKYDPLNFQPSKSSIKIGRSPDCEVVVNDNNLSRFHCFIEYNNVAGWIIKDGYIVKNKDIYEHKASTNGTWMYLNEDYPISEGMIFKSVQTLFLCHVIDDN